MHTSDSWGRRFGAYFIVALVLVFSGADRVHACAGCASVATNATDRLAAEMREEGQEDAARNFGEAAWWREKYPELDEHTLVSVVAFHDLMVERANLVQKKTESQQLIRQARATSGLGADHRSPTAHAYREAVLAVEKALDAHPDLQPYKERVEILQEERRAVAAGQAEVLGAWHQERQSRHTLFNDAVKQAMDTYIEANIALRARAGVERGAALPEAFQAEYEVLAETRRTALAFARDTMQRMNNPEQIAQSRIADGSQAIFDAANEQYKEIDTLQDEIRENMAATRERLRTTDPAIGRLVAIAAQTSQAHLEASEARTDVKAAQALVANFDASRTGIEQNARMLRRDILAIYPTKCAVLDEVAAIGGLRGLPASYWIF